MQVESPGSVLQLISSSLPSCRAPMKLAETLPHLDKVRLCRQTPHQPAPPGRYAKTPLHQASGSDCCAEQYANAQVATACCGDRTALVTMHSVSPSAEQPTDLVHGRGVQGPQQLAQPYLQAQWALRAKRLCCRGSER